MFSLLSNLILNFRKSDKNCTRSILKRKIFKMFMIGIISGSDRTIIIVCNLLNSKSNFLEQKLQNIIMPCQLMILNFSSKTRYTKNVNLCTLNLFIKNGCYFCYTLYIYTS